MNHIISYDASIALHSVLCTHLRYTTLCASDLHRNEWRAMPMSKASINRCWNKNPPYVTPPKTAFCVESGFRTQTFDRQCTYIIIWCFLRYFALVFIQKTKNIVKNCCQFLLKISNFLKINFFLDWSHPFICIYWSVSQVSLMWCCISNTGEIGLVAIEIKQKICCFQMKFFIYFFFH